MTEVAKKYDAVSQFFHWLTVLFVILMLASGFGRDFVPFSARDQVMDLHKSFGLTILLVTGLRIIWRAFRDAPPLPDTTPLPQKIAAHATHAFIYALLIVLPLTGWMMVSCFGKPLSFFGAFDIAALAEKDRVRAVITKDVHEILAFLLSGLIAAHIGAAVFHHFIQKDGLINRMIPHRK